MAGAAELRRAIDTVESRADTGGRLDPRELADSLVEVAGLASELEIRRFEERDLDTVRRELVPAVRELVDRGLEVMDRVLEVHEELGAGPSPDDDRGGHNFYVSIDRVVRSEDRSSHVADLAFMARMELRDKLAELRGTERSTDPWRVLAVCDGCIRRLRKAAAAVETAIADHADLDPRLQFVTEAHLAQLIRTYYGRFRQEIEGEGPPSAETLNARLLSAAASIAKLIGRDFYGDLRVADRAELRSLQGRLRSWLRGEDGYSPDSGLRLWQDLYGFSVLLAQINRRNELLEHDQRIVRAAIDELTSDRATQAEVPPPLLRKLRRLRGRSERIDTLLEEPVSRASETWLAELRWLDDALSARE